MGNLLKKNLPKILELITHKKNEEANIHLLVFLIKL